MMASASFVASGAREFLPRTLRSDLYMPLVGFEIDAPSHALFVREGIVHFVMHCHVSALYLFTFVIRACIHILTFPMINSSYGCLTFLL